LWRYVTFPDLGYAQFLQVAADTGLRRTQAPIGQGSDQVILAGDFGIAEDLYDCLATSDLLTEIGRHGENTQE
jgi:hypothetical protein